MVAKSYSPMAIEMGEKIGADNLLVSLFLGWWSLIFS
jgi:hypothetical protein